MTEDFILWRCLHRGPLSKETIDQFPLDETERWVTHRAKNLPLLTKIIKVYGTCAILARDGKQIVATLRFYPKILFSMNGAGSTPCLLQPFPVGVSEQLVDNWFPPLTEIQDKTLVIHCWTIAPSFRLESLYALQDLWTHMERELIRWAEEQGWKAIELTAYEDTEVLYAQWGIPGRRFWEERGFRVIKTGQESAPWFLKFLNAMQEQMVKRGMNPENAQNKYTLRLELP
jgi:hypothetical protein